MDPNEATAIARSCVRWLSGHPRNLMTPRRILERISEIAEPETRADIYGRGPLIADFEAEVAALLGKESAVFMPSGTMAQQIALRIWSERRGSPHIAFHPTCHLELHEQKGYQLLHGLHAVLVGSPARLMTVDDLSSVAEPLAALLIELPQREIGGSLPAWDDLIALIDRARARGAAVHLDGARLWECQPYYRKPYSEISALFDTVYVSFYKILGGIAGAVLAGPSEFIAEARIWQRRHGGNLYQLYPFVLSAKLGMTERLDRMQAYHEKAVEIGAALSRVPGISIAPDPPQTNMMHVYLRGKKERLEESALAIARETGFWLFYPLLASSAPGQFYFELSAGDASCELHAQEVEAVLLDLMVRAGSSSASS